ncbi:MAG: hypothetical protein K2W96_08520 [Gemmataceae bacterium]|nr:hypothetical protein [Gemmataceae bacterium]
MGLLGWLLPAVGEERLRQAQALMEQHEYGAAARLVRGRRFAPSAKAEGCAVLAESLFQNGEAASALPLAREAVRLAKDAAFLEAAAGNLYEISRYLGETAGAAEMADLLSDLRSRAGDDAGARRYARQAALVRKGEPLLRVVGEVAGQRYEVEELLEGVPGPVRWLFERNRPTPWRVAEAVRQAEEAARAGQFDRAFHWLSKVKPKDGDPAPWYLFGLIHAYLAEWEKAESGFDWTEGFAPGWFHARSALDVLKARDLPLFKAWHALAEGPLSPVQKGALAEQSLSSWPTCGHLHHLHGKALRSLGQGSAAERAFRLALEHSEEPSLVTRACVDLAAVCPASAEKERLLRRAVELGADLPAAATARLVLAFP